MILPWYTVESNDANFYKLKDRFGRIFGNWTGFKIGLKEFIIEKSICLDWSIFDSISSIFLFLKSFQTNSCIPEQSFL